MKEKYNVNNQEIKYDEEFVKNINKQILEIREKIERNKENGR